MFFRSLLQRKQKLQRRLCLLQQRVIWFLQDGSVETFRRKAIKLPAEANVISHIRKTVNKFWLLWLKLYICLVLNCCCLKMCDAFETGKCPSRIFVTSNAVWFRRFQQYLNDNFILFYFFFFFIFFFWKPCPFLKLTKVFYYKTEMTVPLFFKNFVRATMKQRTLETVFTNIRWMRYQTRISL